MRNDVIHGWHTLRNIKGREMKGGGELKLKIELIGIPKNPVYARGINAEDPNSAAVQDAFFQEHDGNQVVMYQVSCLSGSHSQLLHGTSQCRPACQLLPVAVLSLIAENLGKNLGKNHSQLIACLYKVACENHYAAQYMLQCVFMQQ